MIGEEIKRIESEYADKFAALTKHIEQVKHEGDNE